MTVSTELAVATRGVGQAPVAGSEEGVGARVNERDTAQVLRVTDLAHGGVVPVEAGSGVN